MARFIAAKKNTLYANQQAFVCFYCNAIYHDQDAYNAHVENIHGDQAQG